MTDRIILADMDFFGRHGVSDEERSAEQEIDVDVELKADLSRAGASDDLADTVELQPRVRRLPRNRGGARATSCWKPSPRAIATRVLADFQPVLAVTVRVRKPGVPIDGRLEYAGVCDRSAGAPNSWLRSRPAVAPSVSGTWIVWPSRNTSA